eukprot:6189714-Pleurochrysis_carterae.AAC.3
MELRVRSLQKIPKLYMTGAARVFATLSDASRLLLALASTADDIERTALYKSSDLDEKEV